MKRYRKHINFIVGLLLIAALISGCASSPAKESNEGSDKETDAPKGYKEEIIIGVVQNPTNLDPQHNTANASRVITHTMYNSLTFMDTLNKTLKPCLAESWENPSDDVYVFNLRKGVKFHNGNEMTAKDVLYSFERAATMAAAKPYVSEVKNIEIIDDYKIKMTLNAPSAVFLTNISHAVASIIPEGSGDTLSDNPIGTGPYKYVEWLTDNYVLVERFEDYFDGAKPTKYIKFRVIPDHTARNLALEAGDIDVSHNASGASDFSSLQDRDDITMSETRSVISEYFAMEVEKPPFDDVHARKAVAYALDKSYTESAFPLPYDITKSILLPDVFGYNDNVKTYDYNIEKAKEELALSKYPKGFEFNCYTTKNRARYAELLQYNLSEIGIKMNMEYVENVQAQCSPGYTGAHITSINFPALDPDIIFKYIHSGYKGKGGNLTWYENPRIDELVEQGRIELDEAKRKAIYFEIQDILAEDLPIIPLHNSTIMVAFKSNVHNAEVEPTSVPYYFNVYAEE